MLSLLQHQWVIFIRQYFNRQHFVYTSFVFILLLFFNSVCVTEYLTSKNSQKLPSVLNFCRFKKIHWIQRHQISVKGLLIGNFCFLQKWVIFLNSACDLNEAFRWLKMPTSAVSVIFFKQSYSNLSRNISWTFSVKLCCLTVSHVCENFGLNKYAYYIFPEPFICQKRNESIQKFSPAFSLTFLQDNLKIFSINSSIYSPVFADINLYRFFPCGFPLFWKPQYMQLVLIFLNNWKRFSWTLEIWIFPFTNRRLGTFRIKLGSIFSCFYPDNGSLIAGKSQKLYVWGFFWHPSWNSCKRSHWIPPIKIPRDSFFHVEDCLIPIKQIINFASEICWAYFETE